MAKPKLTYGWQVEKRRLHTLDQKNRPRLLEEREAILRIDSDGSERLLGLVSPDYVFVAHDEMFRLVTPWVEQGELEVTSLGEVDGGKQVWVQARLRGDRRLGDDVLIPHLLLVNGFDGHTAMHAVLTPTRVVCANALIAVMQSGQLRRRAHLRERGEPFPQDWVREAIRSYRSLMEEFSAWRDTRLTKRQLHEYVERVVPEVAEPAQAVMRGQWREEIVWLAREGKGNALPGNRGTLWAAYNGVVEFFDHHVGRKQSATSRYFGSAAAFKRNAFVQAGRLRVDLGIDELVEVGEIQRI